MAICYHRKLAYLTDNGLSFKPVEGARVVTIPCGKCLACRVNNAAQWATRAMHESQFVSSGSFITLTYNPDNCPADYSLVKKDLQDFMKRLRIRLHRHNLGSIRAFFACGEYGTKKGRPHYHLLLLGWCPPDLVYFGKSYSGMPIYTSRIIEETWGKGFAPCGSVSCGSAAYVARYQKKGTADNSGDRVKPFFLSSRNIKLSNGKEGAMGAEWVIRNHESLRFGYVPHPDQPQIKCRIPEYYFDLLQKWYPTEYERIKQLRYDYAMEVNNGFFFVDKNGKAKVCVLDDFITPDQQKQVCEFIGVDFDSINPDEFDFLGQVQAKVDKLVADQDTRLSRLRRNYEE